MQCSIHRYHTVSDSIRWFRSPEDNFVKVHADICVIPMGVGVSVSEYVVACQEILNQAGLEIRLHAYGTNVEGEWDDVMAALKQCHERVHELGAPRISTTLRLGTRTDREQSLQDKVDSVASKMRAGSG